MLVKTDFDTAVTALKTAIIIYLCMYVYTSPMISGGTKRREERRGEGEFLLW
jgi:hypothetical protein